MNVIDYASQEEANWKGMLPNLTDYKPFTTFFSDFSIAEYLEGAKGVKDSFKHMFEAWKHDIKYITEMSIVLNHKIWEWHDKGNFVLARTYDEIWKECCAYIEDNFEGDDLSYYFRVTD